MTRYAKDTDVPEDKSRAEIEKTLRRYGASGFMYGWQEGCAAVAFEMHGRRVLFRLPMPDLNDPEIATTPTGKTRTTAQRERALEQAGRQRWRGLALVIKAKLEAVESGITEFEDEFLAHIQLPDGQTAGSWMKPQIARAYETGNMPAMLPSPDGGQ